MYNNKVKEDQIKKDREEKLLKELQEKLMGTVAAARKRAEVMNEFTQKYTNDFASLTKKQIEKASTKTKGPHNRTIVQK